MASGPGDIHLENLTEKTGPPPEERLADAGKARELFVAMQAADKGSASRRSEVQAMMDGKPPYNSDQLRVTGQGGLTNLNFGDAESKQEFAMAGMIDLLASIETLVKVPLHRNAVDDEALRTEYEEILADEVSLTFRRWPRFEANYLTVCHKWLAHGVGIAYFDNCYNWQWEATGLGDIQIPRGVKAGEDFIEIAGCRRGYKLHELYAHMRNERAAKSQGWDIKALRRTIVHAAKQTGGTAMQDWSQIQEGMRNNDLSMSGRSEEISIIHMWVKEFDGSVTMYMLPETAIAGTGQDEKKEPFLYKKRGEYKNMQDAFTFFPYGIGTNGTYHGIQGLMAKIYPQVQVSNRLRSRMVDAAAISAGILLQPETASSYDSLGYHSYGPYTLLPPADVAKFVERQSPNLSLNASPVLADMQHSLDKRAGQTRIDSPLEQGRERTRYEIQTIQDGDSRVGITQLNLFYPPLSRLLRNSTRRLCRLNYSASVPGGKEAEEFRRRLKRKGFPLELLKEIDFDAVECVRSVGAGSFGARTAVLGELTEMAGSYDERGRQNLIRDRTAAALRSYEAANRYAPRPMGDTRPLVDKSIAILQNIIMEMGKEMAVQMNDKHVVHLDEHLPFLADIVDRVNSGQVDAMPLVSAMVIMHGHSTEHLEQLQMDTTIQEKTAAYRQALQQLGEVVFNMQRKLQAQLQKEAQAAGEAGAEPQAGGDDGASQEMVMKLAESRMKLQLLAEQAQLKMQIAREQHSQKMALKDSENAAKILSLAQKSRSSRSV